MRRTTHLVAAAALVLAGLALTACSDADDTDVARDPASDLAPLDERGPCPDRLPEPSDDGGNGFGSEQPAESTPELPEVDRAWLCQYDATDRARPGANGAYLTWDLAGAADPLPPGDMPALVDAVEGLTVPPEDQACTADLGPRYLLVLATPDDGLLAASVDAYGCRDVRLTADPWGGAPGETPAPGVPAGVLAGGETLLALVGAG